MLITQEKRILYNYYYLQVFQGDVNGRENKIFELKKKLKEIPLVVDRMSIYLSPF